MEQFRKLGRHLSQLRVEPAAAFCITGLVLCAMRTDNILLRRVCEVDFRYDKETCDNFIKQNGSEESLEVEIQKEVTNIKSYSSLFVVLTCFVILVTGPLSDIWGRKFLLVLSIIGTTLRPLSIVLLVEFTNCKAMIISFVSELSSCLGGSHALLAMGLFSHIVDITSHEERTWRIGIAETFYAMGSPLGSLIGAVLSDYEVGDIETMYVSIGCAAIGLLIVIVFMKEDTKKRKEVAEDGPEGESKNSCLYILKEFMHTMYKKRDDSGRLKLWLLVIAYLFIRAPLDGEFQLLYLFLRKRLNWDFSQYSYFSISLTSIRAFGVAISIWLLSNKFKLSDSLVGIISSISNIAACLSYAFSYSSLAMYLSSIIDVLNGTLVVVPRTMISKVVSYSEAGRIFTVLAVINAALPSGLIPLYTFVYNKTIDDFEGGFNLLSLALGLPALFILMWFYYKYRQDKFKHSATVSQDKQQRQQIELAGNFLFVPNDYKCITMFELPK